MSSERQVGRELPAWPWAGFLLRLVLSPMVLAGPRCAARRCGGQSKWKHARYCYSHENALLAEHGGSREERQAAFVRVYARSERARKRLEAWAKSVDVSGGVRLVADGYEPPEHGSFDGIVTGP